MSRSGLYFRVQAGCIQHPCCELISSHSAHWYGFGGGDQGLSGYPEFPDVLKRKLQGFARNPPHPRSCLRIRQRPRLSRSFTLRPAVPMSSEPEWRGAGKLFAARVLGYLRSICTVPRSWPHKRRIVQIPFLKFNVLSSSSPRIAS